MYCVLCTVYWICVLDLCSVYCVLDPLVAAVAGR
eukprot:COSAG01_NODE_35581_length_529_cov_189.460465_1_plen_33_part_01